MGAYILVYFLFIAIESENVNVYISNICTMNQKIVCTVHKGVFPNVKTLFANQSLSSIPYSAGKLSITKALDLTSYLKHESEIVPVSQGLGELIPVYKLMEKRDMTDTAQQLKVKGGRAKAE